MAKRSFFLPLAILVVSILTVLTAGSVYAASKIKKSKTTEVERLTYAALDLFCLHIKYDPSKQNSNIDILRDDELNKDQLKILKKYGFKSETHYEKTLERYERDARLTKLMQKIMESKNYQKKYQRCMVLSVPPEQREQYKKALEELKNFSNF